MTENFANPEQKNLRPYWQRAVSACLIIICVGVLLQIYTGSRAGAVLAVCGLVAFAGLGQPWFKLRERFLLGVSVVMTICAYVFSSDAPALVFSALQRAAFLAAFMILLALLRDAAVTSPSVLAVGTFLTKQRPGKRYAALHIGGHALGVVLNFGALSLLGPLVQRGVRGDGAQDKTVTEIRERRQLSALDRGFSWIIAWSPTAVANAMVPVIVVGAQPGRMAMMGGVAAVAMFFVGWLEDKLRFRSLRASLAAKGVHVGIETPKFPKAPFWWFVSICLVLVGLAIAFMVSFQVSMVAALMLAAPLVTALWIWLQNRTRKDAWSASLARYRDIAMNSIPNGSPEALTLSSAGYTGLVAGGLLQAGSFADTLGLNDVPPLMIYIGVAALIPLASNAAMPPMMVVTFLAAMMTSSAMPGLDMTMLGFSFVMGWALNLTGSPFGASSLILSRVTGIPGTTLSWRWNGVFTLVAFLVVSVLVVVFSP